MHISILTPSETIYVSVTTEQEVSLSLNILLKLNHFIDIDASTMLANRAEALHGVTMKQDQTQEESNVNHFYYR